MRRVHVIFGLLALFVLGSLGVVVACYLLGVRSVDDGKTAVLMVREGDRVWVDLFLRRIGQGDSLKAVLDKREASIVESKGPYKIAVYSEPLGDIAVSILAKDDEIILGQFSSYRGDLTIFGNPEELDRFYSDEIEKHE